MTADQTPAALPGRVLVTTEPLDPVAEQDDLTAGNTGIGAVCSFDGLVRAISDGPDSSLSLEHYPGMTERALEDIRQEAGQRWPLLGLSILHRVGRMGPGDRIVSAEGESIADWQQWVSWVQARPNQRVSIDIEREGRPQTVEIALGSIEQNGISRSR